MKVLVGKANGIPVFHGKANMVPVFQSEANGIQYLWPRANIEHSAGEGQSLGPGITRVSASFRVALRLS